METQSESSFAASAMGDADQLYAKRFACFRNVTGERRQLLSLLAEFFERITIDDTKKLSTLVDFGGGDGTLLAEALEHGNLRSRVQSHLLLETRAYTTTYQHVDEVRIRQDGDFDLSQISADVTVFCHSLYYMEQNKRHRVMSDCFESMSSGASALFVQQSSQSHWHEIQKIAGFLEPGLIDHEVLSVAKSLGLRTSTAEHKLTVPFSQYFPSTLRKYDAVFRDEMREFSQDVLLLEFCLGLSLGSLKEDQLREIASLIESKPIQDRSFMLEYKSTSHTVEPS